jgi:hypothetical protein
VENGNKGEIVIYQAKDGQTEIGVRLDKNDAWLNLKQMTSLFKRDKSVISRHIASALKELENPIKSSVAKNATDVGDGRIFEVEYYNLDIIIAVGIRVKSSEGTRFRQWAIRTLKDHIVHGMTFNDYRLKSIEEKQNIYDQNIRVFAMNIRDLYAELTTNKEDKKKILEELGLIKKDIEKLQEIFTQHPKGTLKQKNKD